MNAKPPGWDRAAADSDEDSAADSRTTTTPVYPSHFGYDVVTVIRARLDLEPPFGYDTVDWIEDAFEHDVTTLCPGCGAAWLSGPESLASGLCWKCRTA